MFSAIVVFYWPAYWGTKVKPRIPTLRKPIKCVAGTVFFEAKFKREQNNILSDFANTFIHIPTRRISDIRCNWMVCVSQGLCTRCEVGFISGLFIWEPAIRLSSVTCLRECGVWTSSHSEVSLLQSWIHSALGTVCWNLSGNRHDASFGWKDMLYIIICQEVAVVHQSILALQWRQYYIR